MAFSLVVNLLWPMLLGGIGGLLYAFHNNKKADLGLPHFRRYVTKGPVFKLGFLLVFKEIFIGCGAGFVAANFSMASGAVVTVAYPLALLAGFSGSKYLVKQSVQLTDTKQFDEQINDVTKILNEMKKGQ